jgi:hypothetical protein
LDGQTVRLTRKQSAELHQTTIPNVNRHLRTIYDERGLLADPTIKRYLIVQTKGDWSPTTLPPADSQGSPRKGRRHT